MTNPFETPVGQIIQQAWGGAGLDPMAGLVIAQLESRLNPQAQNPRSSAGGLFQQIDANAREYGVQNRFDPMQSAQGAAAFANDNRRVLRGVLGREPTVGELYLAHQQGPGGARRLLANPSARAVDVVGRDAVRLNGGNENMTAGEFANLWISRAERERSRLFGGGAGQAQVIGQAATDTLSGGQQMAPQTQYTPPEREDTSIWRNVPFLSDADRRARLAIGLEGMTLNPNQQYIQSLQGEVDARREQEQLNETAAWLQSQPGGAQFAQALLSGIPADQVFGAYMQSLAPQAGPDPTSAMQNYEFLLAQGVDPETAIASAFGGGGTNVNVDLGDQGPQIGTIPQGYQLVTDPETGAMSMAPIPGGPEDTSRPDAERIEQGAVGAVNVLETVGDLRRAVEESPAMTTGFIGSILSNIPGSQAYDTQALTNTIRSNLAFDQLQAMREASPTGGALGAVSAPELVLLESNLANLDLGQSKGQVIRQLEVIEREYTRLLRKAYATSEDPAALDAIFGGRPSFISETGAVTTDMTDEELLQLYLNGGQ